MSKKLAKVYYADLWGLREKKYEHLLRSDIQTTKWKKLKPLSPYYFFVPKDFALQAEYEKFWNVREIFREYSSGVKTHRDHFVVGFTKDEVLQNLRIFMGPLPDEIVKHSLKLEDTGTWKLAEARKIIKDKRPEDKIYALAYRPFDTRFICYEPIFIDRSRLPFMNNLRQKNLALLCMREVVIGSGFSHIFLVDKIVETRIFLSNRGAPYFFPLYLYQDKCKGQLFKEREFKGERTPNFTSDFLKSIELAIRKEPAPEEVFSYIYAILYSPTYRKRYEEFLKIDFPRIPLPSNYRYFQKFSKLGQELIDLHLLKHPALSSTEINFPRSGSNKVEKVSYEEKTKSLHINKDQYFENVSKDIWEYRIGAYQVMEKYLKDRKGRKLSLDEINHYLKIAKAIRLTMEIQKKIDKIF
jgi:predicted helicase